MSETLSPSSILRAARDLIATPERWTQKRGGRDIHGNGVVATSSVACCWCAWGALMKVVRDVPPGYAERLLDAERFLDRAAPGGNYVRFNDEHGRTHGEVLDLFSRAIALAETEEKTHV